MEHFYGKEWMTQRTETKQEKPLSRSRNIDDISVWILELLWNSISPTPNPLNAGICCSCSVSFSTLCFISVSSRKWTWDAKPSEPIYTSNWFKWWSFELLNNGIIGKEERRVCNFTNENALLWWQSELWYLKKNN